MEEKTESRNILENPDIVNRKCSKLKNNIKVKHPKQNIKVGPKKKKNIAESLPIPKRSQFVLNSYFSGSLSFGDILLSKKENVVLLRGLKFYKCPRDKS